MSARTRKDWILWGALGCALVSTAHAEYTLATAAHFNEYVALAVPGALDLYVVRALQQRRDVFVAVLAMVAANITSHLIAGGVLEVKWPVIAAVGAVAPLIVWRVYSLKYTRTRQELLWGLPAGADPVAAGAESAPAPVTDEWEYTLTPHDVGEPPCAPPAPDWEPVHDALGIVIGYSAPEPAPAWAPGYHLDGCDGVHALEGPLNCATRASALEATAPDHVPASWMDEEYPETHPSAAHSEASALVHLHSVPDLPPEYAPGAVHSESPLTERDLPFLSGAQEYADNTDKPSVRGLKAALNVGQERAERLLTHLGVIL